MSTTIWYGEGDSDAIDLGDPGVLFKAFAEIGEVLGDDPAYDELQSVPGFAEQMVTPWWLGEVKEQAARFLREKGRGVSDQAHRVLGKLASMAVPTV